MELLTDVLKVLLTWLLNPELLAAGLLVGGLALMALVFKVPFFTAIWTKFTEAFNSAWKEAMANPHVYALLGIAFLVDSKSAVIGALAYVVVRAVADKMNLKL